MNCPFDASAVVQAIKNCLPAQAEVFALHEPCLEGKELEYLADCIRSGWVSYAGSYVTQFETALAAYTGVKRAVAVVNGTVALEMCLKLAGVRPGDEVLVPALTFVATANAVSHCGAIPHFVDSEESTLGMDAGRLGEYLAQMAEVRADGTYNKGTGRRIGAVVPVHTYGHPVDLDRLAETAAAFRLILVEDAAEALGSLYKGRHTGGWGLLSALSFNGNKTITTGGGGAILTNDDALAARAKHLTTTAKVPHRWSFDHDEAGYNYRMPNINAALGCAQLEQLPGFLKRKRELAQRYDEEFCQMSGVRFFREPAFAQSNYWLNVLLLESDDAACRDLLLEQTHANGIMTRPAWTLMHRLPMYRHCPRMGLPVAESLERRLLNLPSGPKLWPERN